MKTARCVNNTVIQNKTSKLRLKAFSYMLLAVVILTLLFACGGSGGNSNASPPPYQKILLNRFPLSLDVLFRTNDITQQNLILDGIRTGRPEASMLFLVPYPNYNHSGHFPATLKWYLYTQSATPVSLPVAGYLEISGDAGKATQVLNGVNCVMDITATIHLSYYIRIQLGHACIDKRLVDAYHAAGAANIFGKQLKAVPVAADEILGSTLPTGAIDFIIQDDTNKNFDPNGIFSYYQNWVNPYLYFTQTVQTQINSYYQIQLNAMAQSGLYPESILTRTYDINEANSFFGTWFYHSGPLQLVANDHLMGWYSFSGSVLNIQNVAKTDQITFWKDANTGQPFGADMIGVFCDALFAGTASAYNQLGGRYMRLEIGDRRNGIVRLDPFFYNQAASTVFLKVQFIEGNPLTIWDDQLITEAFPTLLVAQGGFTLSSSTYYRMYERLN
jgi:hypothetical protein